jgi:predicted nucleic acid-binding protein
MPEIIFADTSFLVAFHNKRDDRHKEARAFINDYIINQTPVAFIITDYIFDETITTIMKQGGKSLAIDTAKKIYESPAIRIISITSEIFNKAYQTFIDYRDQLWSFTDCTSICLLSSLQINMKVAAYDSHFQTAGLEVVTLP